MERQLAESDKKDNQDQRHQISLKHLATNIPIGSHEGTREIGQVRKVKGMKADLEADCCLNRVRAGLSQDHRPKLTAEGTSGAYIFKNDEGNVAVFKPIDEEPYAPNNPRDLKGLFGSSTCRNGVKSGESTLREVAAYLLDHDGFAGVPATSLVEVQHPDLPFTPVTEEQVTTQEHLTLLSELLSIKGKQKSCEISEQASESSYSTINSELPPETPAKVGSLQAFIQADGPIENFSTDLFPTDEIHKIAILDMRLFNLDRNSENILVQRVGQEYRLVPIDHGLTLPDTLEVNSYDITWLSTSQAEEPFSQKSRDYIAALDADKDILMLEDNFKIRPICLRNFKISTQLLQRGAARGLTLTQLSQIFCRPDDDDTEPSLLEKAVAKAE